MSRKLFSLNATLLAFLITTPMARAEQVSVTVPADRSWTRTGIEVRAGDSIEIRASGEIDWGKGVSGPEGRRPGEGGVFRPLTEEPACGLIGRIGAGAFFVGERATIEAREDGELELGINDDKVSDNAGEFRVQIRAGRGRDESWGGNSGTPFGSSGRTQSSRDDDDWARYRDGDRRNHDGRDGDDRDRDDRDDRDRGRDWFWWRGSVDGTDQLILRGDSLTVEHLDKLPIQSQKHRFSRALPDREVEGLRLETRESRGRVRLLQKPSRANDFTAIILLDDVDDRGADWYELLLSWDRPRDSRGGGNEALFRWRGRVDIGCRVVIKGENAKVDDRGGRGTRQRFAEFTAPLPSRGVPVSLRKVRGRGKVRLIETPEVGNGYAAVVEIEDDKGGADEYEFELRWSR